MDNAEHLRDAETHSLPHARYTGGTSSRWIIEHVTDTGSTQTDLLERAADGRLADRTARVADIQHSGRGRLDRRWDAPRGANLLVSLGFTVVPADPGALMRRCALAILAAAEFHGTPDVSLKWPNDVLSGERKIAGLLAQRSPNGPVIVGCGVNVGWAPESGARIGPGDDRFGGDVTPMDVLSTLLRQFDALGADITAPYRERLGTLGRRVRVELGGSTILGIAVDVTDDGRLVVEVADGERHLISVGDVVHLRTVAPR